MTEELKKLLENYPLSADWSSPELFRDGLIFGNLQLQRVGLSASNRYGQLVTGSAVASGEIPLQRAYFELIERMSIIDVERSSDRWLNAYDAEMRWIERSAKDEVFPQSSDPARWRYAKSNGVAAHTDRGLAMHLAHMEVIERDHLLRSWLGERRPERMPLDAARIHEDLLDSYTFEAYLLGGWQELSKTVGVFAFPGTSKLPHVYGFSSRPRLDLAMEKAALECIQSLAFLFDEEMSGELPDFSPTPDYHQALFCRPEAAELIRCWLSGEFCRRNPPEILKKRQERGLGCPRFFDLTPEHLTTKLHVVKAVIPEALPLSFGRFSDLGVKVAPDQEFHPLA